MRARHRATDRLIAYAVLAAATALIVLAHWPGRLDSDSIATIQQVHTGFVTDQRSAVLTWVWRQAYRVLGVGPGVVLTLQVSLLAIGLYLLLRSAFGRVSAAALGAALLFAPPTFGFVALVGRDAWFVSSALVAAGLCVAAARWTGRWRAAALVAGLVAAAVAVVARQNGFTAIFPIVVALALLSMGSLRGRNTRLGRMTARRPTLAAIGAGAVVITAFVGANSLLTTAVRDATDHPAIYTELYDLGYLTVHLQRRFIPSLPRAVQPVQTVADMRGRWLPSTSIYMRWDPKLQFAPGSAPQPYDAAAAKRLDRGWRNAVLDHPLAYLEGRFGLWKRQLGIDYTPAYAMVLRTPPNPWGYGHPAVPGLSRLAARYANHWGAYPGSLTGGPLHHVWPYGICCLLGLALFPLRRFPAPVRVLGALMAAAVGLQVGLFLFAPSAQLRYELLTVYAALVGLGVAARQAWASPSRRRLRSPTSRARSAAGSGASSFS